MQIALLGWVTGYWWCRGRWEHDLWLQWVLLPAFACNADRVWALWQEWYRGGWRENGCLLVLLGLLEWQFWITGIRGGDWWGGPGSGRDFVLALILLTSFALFQREPGALRRLGCAVIFVATLAIACSLVLFYLDYGFSEQRFRLVWRYEPGFNAVTTGLLAGYALVVTALVPWGENGFLRGAKALALLTLSFALSATESRGALLAGLAAGCAALGRGPLHPLRERAVVTGPTLILMGGGFFFYWALAAAAGQSEGEMVARGSAGRLTIYETYLSQLKGWDWWVGQGTVGQLPPEILGWLVHHPHNAYLGQLVGYGLPASLVFGGLLLVVGWRHCRAREWPLFIFGLTACLFDGGQILSLFTLARWETLLVFLPLMLFCGRGKQAT
ncbi:hypothetical protein [Roseibacillus ishigakijimensis]|uniref:O-antigen ligase n=1 Tax=Roseibacillus ishigakijimensis TaxID=454146 RepID=A0A934RQ96_9BACT|nr:hypothetical protein [Roseibacillus ishigakijimensis]